MLICPNGHGPKEGRFCLECGSELLATPPTGDSLRLRSPEAHANASVNPTFILPGATAGGGLPLLVKCPKCGHRNGEADVFDCQGLCGQANLCRRHFDEEYDLCTDCAAVLRGTAAQEAARQVRLEADLADWRGRAQRAEAQLAEHTARSKVQAKIEAANRQSIWHRIGIELITIPAGEFLYGDDLQSIALPEYRIAKTPVTNTQYKAFVDATGYQSPLHWTSGQIPQGKENHPVVNVDWNDAENFCAWVGLRLPMEQEWEKAARGTDGREYPWGSWQFSHCNSDEAKIGDTSPVSRFPSGASPYGLLDMAGNVWEWCADWYDASQEARVWRGGSFYNDSRSVSCAVRNCGSPEYRDVFLGFWVASPGL